VEDPCRPEAKSIAVDLHQDVGKEKKGGKEENGADQGEGKGPGSCEGTPSAFRLWEGPGVPGTIAIVIVGWNLPGRTNQELLSEKLSIVVGGLGFARSPWRCFTTGVTFCLAMGGSAKYVLILHLVIQRRLTVYIAQATRRRSNHLREVCDLIGPKCKLVCIAAGSGSRVVKLLLLAHSIHHNQRPEQIECVPILVTGRLIPHLYSMLGPCEPCCYEISRSERKVLISA